MVLNASGLKQKLLPYQEVKPLCAQTPIHFALKCHKGRAGKRPAIEPGTYSPLKNVRLYSQMGGNPYDCLGLAKLRKLDQQDGQDSDNREQSTSPGEVRSGSQRQRALPRNLVNVQANCAPDLWCENSRAIAQAKHVERQTVAEKFYPPLSHVRHMRNKVSCAMIRSGSDLYKARYLLWVVHERCDRRTIC